MSDRLSSRIVSVALAAAALLAVSLPAAPGLATPGGNALRQATGLTTVILVRHAEKDTTPGDTDPGLTPEGIARAELLASMLGNADVAALYASEFQRTQATLGPLARETGLEVTVHPARDGAGLVELLRNRHRGETVVVAGHSNTVPALVEALGAAPVDAIPESDYHNLYVVTVGEGGAHALRLSFGAEPEAISH